MVYQKNNNRSFYYVGVDIKKILNTATISLNVAK